MSGCGGGGGSSVGATSSSPTTLPTPTPTPAPVPTPTPSPATGSEPTLQDLSSTTQLSGYTGSGAYARDSNGIIVIAPNIFSGPGAPVAYDPQRKNFTYISSGFIALGMPSSGDSVSLVEQSAKSDGSYLAYTGSSAGVLYQLKQFRIGSVNPTLPLLYTSIAYARTSYFDAVAKQTLNGVVPFSFGLIFDPANAKLSGSASYNGILLGVGRGLGGRNAYDVSGTVHIDVNYVTTGYTGFVKLIGTDDRTGDVVTLGQMNISQSGTRGVLDVLIGSIGSIGTGKFQANFTGSQAQELMGGFDLETSDPREPSVTLRITGTLVAKR